MCARVWWGNRNREKSVMLRDFALPESRNLACSRRLVRACSERLQTAADLHKVKFPQGLNCVVGAALSQGEVQISWQAQHFRKSKDRFCGKRRYRFRGRHSTFAKPSTDFVAGAAFSQGQVHISWQGQHLRKVKYRFRGRRGTSQGQVQISWQAQHFARLGTDQEIER